MGGEDRFWRRLQPDGADEGAADRPDEADREWAGTYFDGLPTVGDDAAAVVESDPAVPVALGLVAGFVAGPERP